MAETTDPAASAADKIAGRLGLTPNKTRHVDAIIKVTYAPLLKRMEAALAFYANHNHWMGITESGDHSNLVAHGSHFDGTSDGWVEADAALAELRAALEG